MGSCAGHFVYFGREAIGGNNLGKTQINCRETKVEVRIVQSFKEGYYIAIGWARLDLVNSSSEFWRN